MRKLKSLFLVPLVVAAIAATAYIGSLFLSPHPSEIEKVFDGTEAVFVEGKGLLTAWRDLGRTDYFKSGTYRGLLDLPPVHDALGSMLGAGTAWAQRITPDAYLSAVGDESALGIYEKAQASRFLFASRVDPDFLLMDRILALLSSDTGIVIVPYRGLRVKVAHLDGGRSLLWALDGQLLILSDDPDIFYAALNRHIEKKTGSIIDNREFRRLKRKLATSDLISGYAVTKRIVSILGMEGAFPETAVLILPASFRFSLSYADGAAVIDVSSKGGLDLLSGLSLSGRRKLPVPLLKDGEIAAACVGRMSAPSAPSPDEAGPPLPEDAFPGLLPSLFPDGFSVSVVGVKDGAELGIVALGRESPSFFKTLEGVKGQTGLVERRMRSKGLDLVILKKDRVPYLVWTQRGDRILVANLPDLITDMSVEDLETCSGFRYNSPNGEITFMMKPRLLHRDLVRSDRPAAMPFMDLSLDEQRRLSAALYPMDAINGYASLAGGELRIEIGIHLQDAVP